MKRVAIINCEIGNLDSVARCFQRFECRALITDQPNEIETADFIVLPGVGSFGEGMRNLNKLNLVDPLNEAVLKRKIPFLGICLGMQLLANLGNESGTYSSTYKGLGWIGGRVERFNTNNINERIPHMGWNEVSHVIPSRLFGGIPSGKDFYFCHSYHFIPDDKSTIISATPYGGNFVSSILKENIFGVQFHPEKSQRAGQKLLKNFINF
jgi:glutamine amidotransferase